MKTTFPKWAVVLVLGVVAYMAIGDRITQQVRGLIPSFDTSLEAVKDGFRGISERRQYRDSYARDMYSHPTDGSFSKFGIMAIVTIFAVCAFVYPKQIFQPIPIMIILGLFILFSSLNMGGFSEYFSHVASYPQKGKALVGAVIVVVALAGAYFICQQGNPVLTGICALAALMAAVLLGEYEGGKLGWQVLQSEGAFR